MSDLYDIPRGAKLNRITSSHVRAWNEAARAEMGRAFDSESDIESGAKSATVIDILNNTGATIEQFEILRLTDAVITYSQNELSFRNNWCIKAETPRETTALDSIVVARTSLTSDRIGKATIAGVTPAKVLVGTGEESWKFVQAINGDRTKFAIAESRGIGQIVWKETGIGTKWALVELAGPAARIQRGYTWTGIKSADYSAAVWEAIPVTPASTAPIITLPDFAASAVNDRVLISVQYDYTAGVGVRVQPYGSDKINGSVAFSYWLLLDEGIARGASGAGVGGFWEFIRSNSSSVGWVTGRTWQNT